MTKQYVNMVSVTSYTLVHQRGMLFSENVVEILPTSEVKNSLFFCTMQGAIQVICFTFLLLSSIIDQHTGICDAAWLSIHTAISTLNRIPTQISGRKFRTFSGLFRSWDTKKSAYIFVLFQAVAYEFDSKTRQKIRNHIQCNISLSIATIAITLLNNNADKHECNIICFIEA